MRIFIAIILCLCLSRPVYGAIQVKEDGTNKGYVQRLDFQNGPTVTRTGIEAELDFSTMAGSPASATFVVASDTSNHASSADYQCDGTADEVEINQAINALPATGGKIVLLEGTFELAASITIPDTKTLVEIAGGGGQGTVVKMADGVDIDLIVTDLENADNHFLILRNMSLMGNRDFNTAGRAFYDGNGTYKLKDTLFEDLFIYAFDGDGIEFDNVWGLKLQRCIIEQITGTALIITDGEDAIVTGCKFAANDGNQISIGSSARGVRITNNYVVIQANGTTAITYDGSRGHITGNYIKESGLDAGAATGISLSGDNNIISNNVIQYASAYFTKGIDLVAGADNNYGTANYVAVNGSNYADAGTNNRIMVNDIFYHNYDFIPDTAITIGDGGSSNFIGFDTDGDFQQFGTADYIVAGNKYAFRYVDDEDVGLYFNLTNTRFDFKDTSGTANAHINIDGTITGTQLTSTDDAEIADDLKLTSDNGKLYFGAGDDYSIEWDGSDVLHTVASEGSLTLNTDFASETSVETVQNFKRTTSGTADDGIGQRFSFWNESGDGTLYETGRMDFSSYNATAGNHSGAFNIYLTDSGGTWYNVFNGDGDYRRIGLGGVTPVGNNALQISSGLAFGTSNNATINEGLTGNINQFDFKTSGTSRLKIDSYNNVRLPNDNEKLLFGAGDDYSIEFDATNAQHTLSGGSYYFTRSGEAANLYIETDTVNKDTRLWFKGDRTWGFINDGDGNLVANDYFHLYDSTAGTSRLVVDTSGYVGIGNHDPENILHIKSADEALINLECTGIGAGDNAGFLIKNGAGRSGLVTFYEDDVRKFFFGTDPATDVFHINYWTGATWEPALTVDETTGDLHIPADSKKIYFGAGDDYSIEWNGSAGIHTANGGLQLHDGASTAGAVSAGWKVATDNQYAAEYITTDSSFAGFLVRAAHTGSQPFVQLYNSVNADIWTMQLTTSDEWQLRHGNASTGDIVLEADNSFNLHIPNDSKKLYFGTGDDGSITHTGSSLDIASDNTTVTDELNLRGGTNGIDFLIGATEQMTLTDGALTPTTDNDVDMGSSSNSFKSGYYSTVYVGGSVVYDPA